MGACLVRKVCSCKNQIPDSFPFVLEKEFGPEAAQGYEEYVVGNQKNSLVQIEPLAQALEFGTGVDHINQVLSYHRLIYFGYIFEESGLLSKHLTHGQKQKKLKKPQLVFGKREMQHVEIRQIQETLIDKVGMSASKIRQAGEA